MKDLNVSPDPIKFLERNISSMLFDISLSNFFGSISSGEENKSKNK